MRATAAAFVRDLVRPAVAGWERDGAYPREAVAGSGLTGLFCPLAVGGAELGFAAGMEVFEELGRGDAALAFSLSMHNAVAAAIAGCNDDALRTRWGADLAAGRALGGFSLTEPQAGSDATAITTLARRPDGGGWRVSGRKAWVSLAGEADLFLVVCKTGDGAGACGHRAPGGRGGRAGGDLPAPLPESGGGVPADRRNAARRRTGDADRAAG